MKAFKLCMRVLLVVAVLTVFSAFSVKDSHAAAPKYNGNFCWEITLPGDPPFSVRLGVTYVGGNHYQFNGVTFGATKVEIIGGSGDIFGGKLQMVLYTSTFNDDNGGTSPGGFGTSIASVILNVGTLNGTVKSIDHFSDASGVVIHQTDTGTVQRIPCP